MVINTMMRIIAVWRDESGCEMLSVMVDAFVVGISPSVAIVAAPAALE